MERIVMIGGGVSNIAAAIKLINEGYDGKYISIIEKGKSIDNRQPDEIMNGFGGAGAFSDHKNCYSLYQGGELLKYTGEEKGLKLIDQFKKIIRQFHPNPESIETVGIKKEPSFLKKSRLKLKQSEIEHLGTEFGQEICRREEIFLRDAGVKMYFKHEIYDIDLNKREVYAKNKEADFILEYDRLLIGIGKSGMTFLNEFINKYKLKTSPKAVQMGVRFESDYAYFEKIAKDFYDFKLSIEYGKDISCRSFCVNNERAFIAVEDNNGMKSYNGHAYKDESKHNGLINFGIMLEIRGINDPLKFTKQLVENCNWGDLGKWYSPNDRKPTIDCLRITEDEFSNLYDEYSIYILDYISKLNEIFQFDDDYVFYLPEIKYLTEEIEVNNADLSLLKYPTVHIIGDSLSARGIVVSAAQGIYTAESIIDKNRGELNGK